MRYATRSVEPSSSLRTLTLEARGKQSKPVVHALVANLKSQIGLRELETAGQLLGLEQEQLRLQQTRESTGPGNVVMIEVASEHVTELFMSFGKVGVSAEKVAMDAVKQTKTYIDSNAAVGEHLADQLLLPMALSGGGSFTATEISSHARTNMEIIARFLPVHFDTEERDGVQRTSIASTAL